MQQRALRPLSESWSHISEGQKRKWIALQVNFEKLPAAEQAKLQERMTEWAALSAAQRNQARLNFAETKKLSPTEKQAKWQAYQALSDEEKQKLAQRAPKPPAGAAHALRPVAKQKLANVPVDHTKAASEVTPEAFHRVDRNTLLPQQP